MNSKSEPKWTNDLGQLFNSCLKIVTGRPIVFSALLAMSLIQAVWPITGILTFFVQAIISAFLGFAMIKLVWQDQVPAEQSVTGHRTPWIRLCLLEGTYASVTFLLCLFLLIPGIWWGVCSSLAYVLVSIEDCGFIESISKSHKLLKGHFWLAVRYLVPVTLLIVLPTELLYAGAGDWCDSVHKQSSISTPLLATISVASVVTTAIAWLAWLTSLGLLVRLYAYVKAVPTD
jgi:hypothetical protein